MVVCNSKYFFTLTLGESLLTHFNCMCVCLNQLEHKYLDVTMLIIPVNSLPALSDRLGIQVYSYTQYIGKCPYFDNTD